MILLLLACASTPPETGAIFVRDGLVVPAPAEGTVLPGDRVLVERAWRPGESVDGAGIAPARAECVPLFSVGLGDVSRLVAQGGDGPDTSLAFSPDGQRLAVGSYRGEVIVIDGWSGEVIARQRLAETVVKQVAWSPDGATLYTAEQSPDAFVSAMDPATLRVRWRFRLADEVGTSAPPPGEELYGVYTLPGSYGLHVLPDGSLLVAAVHGWNDEAGVRRNRSRLLRLSAEGTVAAAWPAEGAADATLMNPRVDAAGGLLVVPVGRSAEGPAPDLPVGGVQILALPELTPVASVVVPPLEPWFQTAFLWEALDLHQDNLLLGFGDGRMFVERVDRAAGTVRERAAMSGGSPVMAGEVPVVASAGFGLLHENTALFQTAGTNIPWGAAAPDLRPPMAHPGENTLWASDLDGIPRWNFHGAWRLSGLSLGGDGRHAVVGAGNRVADERRDLYGALVFDLDGDERSGEQRLEAFCATEGPVFFRQAMSADGRLAVAEHPYREADGTLSGAYRVTVLR